MSTASPKTKIRRKCWVTMIVLARNPRVFAHGSIYRYYVRPTTRFDFVESFNLYSVKNDMFSKEFKSVCSLSLSSIAVIWRARWLKSKCHAVRFHSKTVYGCNYFTSRRGNLVLRPTPNAPDSCVPGCGRYGWRQSFIWRGGQLVDRLPFLRTRPKFMIFLVV